MKCSCMAPLTPDVMVINDFTFELFIWIMATRGSYFGACVQGLVRGKCHGSM